MLDFSVVICTYNGEAKLPQLLERLQKSSPFSTSSSSQPTQSWEVLIVDNNSSDKTAALISQYQQQWRSDVPLRYCFEPRQGLAYARRCALKNTSSPVIGFLDDDVLPDLDWVSAAIAFGHQHPTAGAWGSNITGQYEIPPPPEFERIACCLAIIERGPHAFQYASDRGVLPAGAGMVIRRQAWLEQVPDEPRLSGVRAGSLDRKGEDVETLSYIRKAWPIWHNPAMKLSHIMPAERLTPSYLRNILLRIGFSRYNLRQVHYSRRQWLLWLPLYFANDLRKLISRLLYLLFNLHRWGTVEQAECLLLLGSTISPFYHAVIRLRQIRQIKQQTIPAAHAHSTPTKNATRQSLSPVLSSRTLLDRRPPR